MIICSETGRNRQMSTAIIEGREYAVTETFPVFKDKKEYAKARNQIETTLFRIFRNHMT